MKFGEGYFGGDEETQDVVSAVFYTNIAENRKKIGDVCEALAVEF